MPSLPPKSMTTRKRTRSTNVTESNVDHQQVVSNGAPAATTTTVASNSISTTTVLPATMPSLPTNTNTLNAPPKRQRNNPPPTGPPPPVAPRTHYSLRNRSLTPDPRRSLTRFPSVNPTSTIRQRYNLRTRRPESQIRLPQVSNLHPAVAPRRFRRPLPPITQSTPISLSSTNFTQPVTVPIPAPILPPSTPSTIPIPSPIPPLILPTPPAVQPRQIRLVYISDEDDDPPITTPSTDNIVESVYNLIAADDDNLSTRSTAGYDRASRAAYGGGFNIRSRTTTATPSSASSTSSSSTINTHDFITGVAHIRLNRAIEIVIDSIQSLEGAANNFDQLVFGLIYGRLGTRTEFDSIESMIRLSRILSLNLPPPRLTQEEIDSLPKIIFVNKTVSTTSIHLAEKCPICLTEFNDQETINKLHCTHLFHLQCISTWLSENDSCPTCRRKATGD